MHEISNISTFTTIKLSKIYWNGNDKRLLLTTVTHRAFDNLF